MSNTVRENGYVKAELVAHYNGGGCVDVDVEAEGAESLALRKQLAALDVQLAHAELRHNYVPSFFVPMGHITAIEFAPATARR